MKTLTRLGIYFYTIILLLIAVIMIGFAVGYLDVEEISLFLKAFDSLNVRLVVGLVGVLLILICYVFDQVMFSGMKREKTIAFQTTSGEVLVSLNAVEDLIRRITSDIEGIKDARPNVIASKKGIEITLRLGLSIEVNIPDFTAKIQKMLKDRVQDVLGIDEAITVKIFVVKIENKEAKPHKRKENEEEAPIPFQGYKR